MSILSIPYRIVAQFGYSPVGNNGVDELIYRCPECINRKGSPDTSGHLYVNVKNYKFHCHRCGYSGKIGYRKINQDLIYDETIDQDSEELFKNIDSLINTKEKLTLKIPINKITSSSTATQYLLNRGFTYQQMKYYDLRVGTLEQEFGRIIIPNKVDHLVYTDTYSARTYIGQIPKYHNPSQIKKSEIVFNLHRIKEGTPIILVEGALTAIAAGYHAVASLGKNLSISQASQIAQKKPSVIYVNYDYDAQEYSHKACSLLYKYLPDTPILEVIMKDDRDAADLSCDEYVECLKNAIKYQPLYNDIFRLIQE